MTSIPLQQDAADLPERDGYAWAFVSLPMQGTSATMVVQPSALTEWSRHIYDLGFRHFPELQTKKYSPGPSNENWFLGSSGSWVPMEEVLAPEVTAPDMSHLTLEEKRVIFERLSQEFEENPVSTDYAEVIQ